MFSSLIRCDAGISPAWFNIISKVQTIGLTSVLSISGSIFPLTRSNATKAKCATPLRKNRRIDYSIHNSFVWFDRKTPDTEMDCIRGKLFLCNITASGNLLSGRQIHFQLFCHFHRKHTQKRAHGIHSHCKPHSIFGK